MSEVKLYKHCLITDFVPEGLETYHGDVRFEDNKLVLSYTTDDNERIVWECVEEGAGHYICKTQGEDFSGVATMHRFQKGTILEGYWEIKSEDDINSGMWRISLNNPWKAPEVGDWVIIQDPKGESIKKQQVIAIEKNTVKFKKHKPVSFSEFGKGWTYAKD